MSFDTLPENKYTTEHPLTIVKNGFVFVPEVIGDSLTLESDNVKSVLLNTLNYLHIKSLFLKNNPLTFLADVYSLHTLDCSNCKLKVLPSYMPNLTTLACSDNILTNIPKYQQLIRLNCSGNLISRLPQLPNLKSLTINNNPIHEINIPTLTYLEAYGCPILTLFDIQGLSRRSSILDKFGSFKWITTRTEKIDAKSILNNWITVKLDPVFKRILNKSQFWKKVLGYIFKE